MRLICRLRHSPGLLKEDLSLDDLRKKKKKELTLNVLFNMFVETLERSKKMSNHRKKLGTDVNTMEDPNLVKFRKFSTGQTKQNRRMSRGCVFFPQQLSQDMQLS